MQPFLETIAQTLNYGDLPETWRVPDIDRFSPDKTLYDYQKDALRNAARALYLYYEKSHDWRCTEQQDTINRRKQDFANRYATSQIGDFTIKKL